MEINEGNYGEKLYAITLSTGTAWTQTFEVYAYHEQEAVDIVADYCEDHRLEGLYSDYYELAELCEVGQTVDEYAEANSLTCCGNHGIYMQILGIQEVTK